jgi:hypothetical protein
VINAERAAMYAPDFRGRFYKTRAVLLNSMISSHLPKGGKKGLGDRVASFRISKPLTLRPLKTSKGPEVASLKKNSVEFSSMRTPRRNPEPESIPSSPAKRPSGKEEQETDSSAPKQQTEEEVMLNLEDLKDEELEELAKII